jgi:two-component system NtrC family sensor kinase
MINPQLPHALPTENSAQRLEQAALAPAGFEVTYVPDRTTVETLLKLGTPDGLILREPLVDGGPGSGLELAASLLDRFPTLPVILFTTQPAESLALQGLRLGVMEILTPPLRPDEVQQAVRRVLQRRQRMIDWTRLEIRFNTKSLERKLSDLETLLRVSRKVTGSLDLDDVLTAVVDAAVELTDAEEGSLMLLDGSSGELYMQAARNFQEEFVRTFRMPVHDTLLGEVVRSGKPAILQPAEPHKIKTAFLVHSLMYVPLVIQERVTGVLSVDNRCRGKTFSDYDLHLVSALADYAAIAIENARLFERTQIERNKLETVLTQTQDGVIVIDADRHLMLVNRAAQAMFGLESQTGSERPVDEVFHHPGLLEMLNRPDLASPYRSEITLEDGRVFNAQATPIAGVGLAVILQDITSLKELDQIKSDFVNTVSHDLRSPLTAILGYVELIDRVGPVTPQQAEFIRRVQAAAGSITALINDLLDLGRIEAGFDQRKEVTSLPTLVRQIVESLASRTAQKNLTLEWDLPAGLPPVFGDPIRLKQMAANLVDNAIKYTPDGGRICLHARTEDGQVIFQVIDSGLGIPLADQPYIFDKFYRGKNIAAIPGTGLGLAIVKSIVDQHQGRIWVDSAVGKGTSFTVVLPIRIRS